MEGDLYQAQVVYGGFIISTIVDCILNYSSQTVYGGFIISTIVDAVDRDGAVEFTEDS